MPFKLKNSCVLTFLASSMLYQHFALANEQFTDDIFNLSLEQLLAVKVSTGQRSSETSYRELAVPVRVITQAELRRTGYTELGKVLQRFEVDFNFPRTHITDLSDAVRPASLRGLSPSHTLILINGKRIHDSAVLHLNNSMGRGSTSADINSIPIVAIKKIEILKDGAAAQYGSDAIAGVINIILDQKSGKQVTVTHGQTEFGDGQVEQVDFRIGEKFEAGGSWQASFEARNRGSTNRSEGDARQQYFDGDPRNDDLVNVNGQIYGDPKSIDRLFWLNGDYVLSSEHSIYFSAGYNQRDVDSNGFFRRPLDDRNVRAIYPDGFLPKIISNIHDWNTVVGINSKNNNQLDQWFWDLSLTSGQNSLAVDVSDSVNVSMGISSPTDFYAGKLINDSSSLNGLMTKNTKWRDMPFDISIGSEWRFESFQIDAGEEASYIHGGVPILDGPNAGNIASAGSQVFPGFKPENEVDVSRNSLALFVESKLKISDSLLLQTAIRTEQYSDFGGHTDGKLALAYTPSQDWLMRASTNTGFRAPSIAQSSYRATSTSFFENAAYDVGTFGVDEPVAIALGATELKPETSQQFSYGFAYYGVKNLSISFDAFNTKIKDQIVLSGAITRNVVVFGQEVVDILDSYQVGGVRFFSNAVDTKTTGYDFSVDYEFVLASQDKLKLSFDYHHNQSKITEGPRAPQLLENNVEILFDRREQFRLVEGQPDNNLSFKLRYLTDNYSIELRQYQFGSFKTAQANNNPDLDFEYGEKWLTDLHLEYQLEKNLKFSLGGHNIFDQMPDYRNETTSTLFGEGLPLPYHQLSPFGFNGAYFYFSLSYGF